MGDYRIVTDSTADLPQELVDKLDVTVIPMAFKIGEDSYLDYPDEHELASHDFYKRIAAGEEASTTQISIAAFSDTFEQYLKEGLDVLYIGFSSGLSGTYNNSVITAKDLREKYPERKIITVDSLAASMGEGLLVYYAVMHKRSGAGLEDVAKWIESNRNRLHHWFTVDDLNHLKRGGRISGTSALVGTMLGIKPVLHFDDSGHIILMQKIRGRKQSLNTLVEHMEQTAENPSEQTIFISHSDSLEAAGYVEKQVKEKFGVSKTAIAPIGPVIGVHTGTGTVALFYLGNDRGSGSA
ncbi:MAG TPA: fatty acid-binding protein DegV [Ruminococcaceae bacterium]|nr:fatty acid-binding protein DegV [Oscillospiraceae bacterium]